MAHTRKSGWGQFGSVWHLAGRFAGSLLPVGPGATDERWARGQLLPGEQTLWSEMSGADRRHAVGVARRTVELLGAPGDRAGPGREVVAAALLHDVGKIESGFGTWARSAVTLAAIVKGREALVAWSSSGRARGRRGRVGSYLSHDTVGADMLLRAGSDPLTVAWAREHHRPPEAWSVDAGVAEALKAADDD